MGKDDHVASEPVNFRESVQCVRFLKLRCEAQYRFLGRSAAGWDAERTAMF